MVTMIKDEKAQVSIQFNWIFVLVAGAIILLFFAGIVIRQRGVSETRFCGAVLNSMEATFSIVGESSGTEKITEMPKQTIELDCREYRCSGTENIPPKSTMNLPIFGPGELKGLTVVIASKEWDLPFRVINFLYVTNQEVRYYLVYGDSGSESYAQYIYDELPDNITKDLVSFDSISDLPDYNDNKVRFVFVDVGRNAVLPEFFSRYGPEDLTSIKITSQNRQVSFYDRFGANMGDSYYINDIDLMAAIFSDDYENFDCAMKKAYKRLNYVTTVNYHRMHEISEDVDQTSLCPFIYDNVLDELETLKAYSESCSNQINFDCVSGVYTAVSDLRTFNTDLIKESCPLLY